MVVAAFKAYASVAHEAVARKPVEAHFHDVVVHRQQRVENAAGHAKGIRAVQADQRLLGVLKLVVEVGVEVGRPAIGWTDLEAVGDRVRLVEHRARWDVWLSARGQIVDRVEPIEVAVFIAADDRQPSLGVAAAPGPPRASHAHGGLVIVDGLPDRLRQGARGSLGVQFLQRIDIRGSARLRCRSCRK